MILEEITAFNFLRYIDLMSTRWKSVAYTIGIPCDNDDVWLGCRTDKGDPAGILIGNSAKDNRYQLQYLFVIPKYRRQGYGSAMLKYLLEQLLPERYESVYFCYTPDFDCERDSFFDFAETMKFEHRVEKVLFIFDPETVISQCSPHEMENFEIVREKEMPECGKDLQMKKHDSLQAVYAYDPFTDFSLPEMRDLRNQVVLTPYGDMYRIIEKETGKEAGFFSATVCNQKYYTVSAVCIYPEYRSKKYLWTKPVIFSARTALERGLLLASYVFYWRSGEIRFYKHFQNRFGLKHYKNTFYFKLTR